MHRGDGYAGGCPEGVRHTDVPHEVEGVEDDVSGPVTEGVFESVDDLCALIDRTERRLLFVT